MLDMTTTKLVYDAITAFYAPYNTPVTMDDVRLMKPISISSHSGGYTILALQCGDLTLLVWMQVDSTGKQIVRRVKKQDW